MAIVEMKRIDLLAMRQMCIRDRHDTVEGMLSFSGKEGMETWRMKSFI